MKHSTMCKNKVCVVVDTYDPVHADERHKDQRNCVFWR